MADAAQDRIVRAKRALQAERCRRSAQFAIFESGTAFTKDEHDAQHPVKAFPDIPYLRATLDCLLVAGRLLPVEDASHARAAGVELDWLARAAQSGIVLGEKSRQVMFTWLVCHYLRWRAWALPHQLILVQSKKEEDAANLVFNKDPHMARISFIETQLPRHLRGVSFPGGGAYGHLYWPNGSHIWGIPEGGHIIRSNTPSVVFSDEAAFQPEFGAAYTAALPAIKGGGQFIGISSAEVGEFASLVGAEA